MVPGCFIGHKSVALTSLAMHDFLCSGTELSTVFALESNRSSRPVLSNKQSFVQLFALGERTPLDVPVGLTIFGAS